MMTPTGYTTDPIEHLAPLFFVADTSALCGVRLEDIRWPESTIYVFDPETRFLPKEAGTCPACWASWAARAKEYYADPAAFQEAAREKLRAIRS